MFTNLTHAKMMLDRGATIEYTGAKMDDGQEPLYKDITIIHIVDEINLKNHNKFSFHIYPNGLPNLPMDMHLRLPSGKQSWTCPFV